MQLRTVTKRPTGNVDEVGPNTTTRGAFKKVTRLEETATARYQNDEKRRTYRYLVAGGFLDEVCAHSPERTYLVGWRYLAE
jgi:hypothetical protein